MPSQFRNTFSNKHNFAHRVYQALVGSVQSYQAMQAHVERRYHD